MSLYDYTDRDDKTELNIMIGNAGFVFTICFTVECVFKIITMGFILNKNAYLRDGWNWIDFLVVCVG